MKHFSFNVTEQITVREIAPDLYALYGPNGPGTRWKFLDYCDDTWQLQYFADEHDDAEITEEVQAASLLECVKYALGNERIEQIAGVLDTAK